MKIQKESGRATRKRRSLRARIAMMLVVAMCVPAGGWGIQEGKSENVVFGGKLGSYYTADVLKEGSYIQVGKNGPILLLTAPSQGPETPGSYDAHGLLMTTADYLQSVIESAHKGGSYEPLGIGYHIEWEKFGWKDGAGANGFLERNYLGRSTYSPTFGPRGLGERTGFGYEYEPSVQSGSRLNLLKAYYGSVTKKLGMVSSTSVYRDVLLAENVHLSPSGGDITRTSQYPSPILPVYEYQGGYITYQGQSCRKFIPTQVTEFNTPNRNYRVSRGGQVDEVISYSVATTGGRPLWGTSTPVITLGNKFSEKAVEPSFGIVVPLYLGRALFTSGSGTATSPYILETNSVTRRVTGISGSAAVQIPGPSESNRQATYSVTKEVNHGSPTLTGTWSISGGTTGVSINSSTGVLTVGPNAQIGTVTVKFTPTGALDNTPVSKTVTLKRDKYAQTIKLSPSAISTGFPVSSGAIKQVQFSASVTDQYGAPIKDRSVTWSISNTAGVTIDSKTGVVTITGTNFTDRQQVTVTAKMDQASASATLTLRSVPELPETLTVKQTDVDTMKLSWNPPSDTGGGPLTGYMVSCTDSEGNVMNTLSHANGLAREAVLTGLTKGETYTFAVQAANALGISGVANVSAVAWKDPEAPVLKAVFPGNGSAEINFTPPKDNGGDEITGYKIYADGVLAGQAEARDTSALAEGLTNGHTYHITVTAENRAGESTTQEGLTVTPGLPRTPENVQVRPVNGGFRIAWDPAAGNGSEIKGYRLYVDGSETPTAEVTTTEYTTQKFVNGTKHTVRLSAVNAAGESEKTIEYALEAGTPAAPQRVDAVLSGEGTATVRWEPADNSGNRMTGYVVYVGGEKVKEVSFAAGEAEVLETTVGGIEAGVPYVIQVAGVNLVGEGMISKPVILLAGAPGAPALEQLKGEDGSLTLNFSAQGDGGSPITDYHIYLNDRLYKTISPTAVEAGSEEPVKETVVIDQLANGVPYRVKVTAENSNGEGPASVERVGIPSAPSAAPRDVSTKATGPDSVSLSWKAPLNSGGLSVSHYEVKGWTVENEQKAAELGADQIQVLGTGALVSGLTKGGVYVFEVTAVTEKGSGEAAESPQVKTWTEPDSPVLSGVRPGNGGVALSWEAPENDGGSPVTGYQVYVDGVKRNAVPLTENTYQLTGLENGISYGIRLAAVNSVGEGSRSVEKNLTAGVPESSAITELKYKGADTLAVSYTAAESPAAPLMSYKIYINGRVKKVVDDVTATTTEITGLASGQTYEVQVSATNVYGESVLLEPWSIAMGAPDTPVLSSVQAKDRGAELSWETPAQNGAELTEYRIYVDGSLQATCAAISAGDEEHPDGIPVTGISIDGLTKNEQVKLTVTAANQWGESKASNAIAVKPYGPPDEPEIPELKAGNEAFTLSFELPKDGGSPLTAYGVYVNGEKVKNVSLTEAQTGERITEVITGMENGTPLTVAVSVENLAGEVLSQTAEIVPGVPETPTITEVILEQGGFTVKYDTPAENGAPIEKYTLYVNGTEAKSVQAGSIRLTDLTDGVECRLELTATNRVGESPRSPVVTVAPGRTSQPLMQSVTEGDRSLTVSLKAPYDNAETVSKYILYLNGQPVKETVNLEETITGLENGVEYTVRATAVNPMGESLPSAELSGTPHTVPGAPQNAAAKLDGEKDILLSWDAPADDGGSAISGYVVSGRPADGSEADFKGTITVTGTTAKVTGLEKGKEYIFSIAAENRAGTGAAAETEVLRTRAVPGAPRITGVEAENAALLVSWEAPADKGSSELLGYNVYAGNDPESLTKRNDAPVKDLSYAVLGLENEKVCYVEVTAVNDTGESEPSTRLSSTPHGYIPTKAPEAPRDVKVTQTRDALHVTWREPVYDGGSPLVGYKVYVNGVAVSGDPRLIEAYDVTGFNLGSQYTIAVSAVNGVGEGSKSDVVKITPEELPVYGQPAAPGNVKFISNGTDKITLSWEAPADDGGSPIESYKIYVNDIETATVDRTKTSYQLAAVLQQTYNLRVAAVNEAEVLGVKSPTVRAMADLNVDLGTGVDALGQVTGQPDGIPDLNIDLTGNGKADLNIDTNRDQIADLNIDCGASFVTGTDQVGTVTGKPDGKADLNIDTDGDGKADLNIDCCAGFSESGTPEGDPDGKPDLNVDTDGDGTADLNLDVNEDGIPDRNLDLNQNWIKDSEEAADLPVNSGPSAPENVKVLSNGEQTELTVRWDAPKSDGNSAVTEYIVTVENGEPGTADYVQNVHHTDAAETAARSYTFAGTAGVTYRVTVKAVNEYGESPYSTQAIGALDLNIDTDGDGEANKNVDVNGDGTADIPDLDEGGGGTVVVPEVSEAPSGLTATVVAPIAPASEEPVEPLPQQPAAPEQTDPSGADNAPDGNSDANAVPGGEPGSVTDSVTEPSTQEGSEPASNTPESGLTGTLFSDLNLAVTGLYATAAETAATADGWTVDLTWNAPTGAGADTVSEYKIYVNGQEKGTVSEPAGSFAAVQGETYLIAVSAVNAAGESAQSDPVTITVEDESSTSAPADVPAAPAGLNATVSGGAVIVTWTKPAGELTGQTLFLETDGSTNEIKLAADAERYEFDGSAGKTYTISVRAENAAGNGSVSSKINVTMESAPAVVTSPFAPTGLKAVAATDGSITLSWTAPENDGGSPITGYVIYKDGVKLDQTGTETTFTFAGTTEGAVMAVAAVNEKGEGARSATVVARTDLNVDSDGDGIEDTNVDVNGNGDADQPSTKPDGDPEVIAPYAPGKPSYVSNNEAQTIKFSWTAPENDGGSAILAYHVYVTVGEQTTEYTVSPAALTWTLADADANSRYQVRVAAENEKGTGGKSATAIAKLTMNVDSNGDGAADSNLDSDGDGVLDTDAEASKMKIEGTVVQDDAIKLDTVVVLYDEYGVEVERKTVSAGSDGSFSFETEIQPSPQNFRANSGETQSGYSIEVTRKNSTVTVVEEIPVTTGAIQIPEKLVVYQGDVDKNGRVNAVDLSLFQNMVRMQDVIYDVNGDGKLNSLDVSMINNYSGGSNIKKTFSELKGN